jgi:hypothetical protein
MVNVMPCGTMSTGDVNDEMGLGAGDHLFDKLGQHLRPENVVRQGLLFEGKAQAPDVVQKPASKVSCRGV